MERSLLIAAVREHAQRNYERNGGDILIECWSDEDISKAIGKATSLRGAIEGCHHLLGIINDRRTDIEAEVF